MKNKIDIYILSGVIILLSLYIVLQDNKNINYDIPKLENFTKEDITKITFKDLTISKKDNTWFLSSGYEVDSYKIDRMLSDAQSLKIIDMISDNEDYRRFGLDNPSTLKVYKNEMLLLELDAGKTSSTGNYTYIKLPEHNEVYSVRGSIKDVFDKHEGELRSKRVLTINEDKISQIKITRGADTVIKNRDEAKELLASLKTLDAYSFKELDISKVIATVDIVGEESKTLMIFEKVDDLYPATSTDVSFQFTLQSWMVDPILGLE